MTAQHTPTPWSLELGKNGCVIIRSENGVCITCNDHDSAMGPDKEDAAHIVKCVNAHEEIMQAIESVIEAEDNYCNIEGVDTDKLRALVKRVHGQA